MVEEEGRLVGKSHLILALLVLVKNAHFILNCENPLEDFSTGMQFYKDLSGFWVENGTRTRMETNIIG